MIMNINRVAGECKYLKKSAANYNYIYESYDANYILISAHAVHVLHGRAAKNQADALL